MKKLYTIVICIGLAVNLSDLNANAYFDWDKAKQIVDAVKLPYSFARLCYKNDLLIKAVSNGSLMQTRLLLQLGADVNIADHDGNTALMLAAISGHREITELLLQARADINATNDKGYTALMAAAVSERREVAGLLLQAGANINAVNNNGLTALILAANSGHQELAELLLQKRADIHVVDDQGCVALIHAAAFGHHEVAKLLLQAGADVNTVESSGCTSLMVAADSGYQKVAELFLQAGADINAANNKGFTALMRAAHKGHREITKLLLQAGANVNAVDHRGKTAIHFAFNKLEIRQLLERYSRFKFVKKGQQFDSEPKLEEDILIPAGRAADIVCRILELHSKQNGKQIDAFVENGVVSLHNKVQSAYRPFVFENNFIPLRNFITQEMYTEMGLLPQVVSFFNSRTDFLAVQNELKQGATKQELERLQIIELFVNRK